MADDDNLMDQSEIEQLLGGGGGAAPDADSGAADQAADQGGASDAPLDQSDIESLLGGGGGSAPPAAEAAADPAPAASAPAATAPEAPAATPSTDADKLLGQDDIEKLLNQAQGGAEEAKPAAKKPAAKAADANPLPGEGEMSQGDVEFLLNQAEQALASIDSPGEDDLPVGVTAFRLDEFQGAPASTESATLDLIRDVQLDLKIELGRTHMYLEDVLKLRKGAVVPLDKLAGDPVDIYVNGRLIARGEVLVLNDNFCVRVAELISGTDVFA